MTSLESIRNPEGGSATEKFRTDKQLGQRLGNHHLPTLWVDNDVESAKGCAAM